MGASGSSPATSPGGGTTPPAAGRKSSVTSTVVDAPSSPASTAAVEERMQHALEAMGQQASLKFPIRPDPSFRGTEVFKDESSASGLGLTSRDSMRGIVLPHALMEQPYFAAVMKKRSVFAYTSAEVTFVGSCVDDAFLNNPTNNASGASSLLPLKVSAALLRRFTGNGDKLSPKAAAAAAAAAPAAAPEPPKEATHTVSFTHLLVTESKDDAAATPSPDATAARAFTFAADASGKPRTSRVVQAANIKELYTFDAKAGKLRWAFVLRVVEPPAAAAPATAAAATSADAKDDEDSEPPVEYHVLVRLHKKGKHSTPKLPHASALASLVLPPDAGGPSSSAKRVVVSEGDTLPPVVERLRQMVVEDGTATPGGAAGNLTPQRAAQGAAASFSSPNPQLPSCDADFAAQRPPSPAESLNSKDGYRVRKESLAQSLAQSRSEDGAESAASSVPALTVSTPDQPEAAVPEPTVRQQEQQQQQERQQQRRPALKGRANSAANTSSGCSLGEPSLLTLPSSAKRSGSTVTFREHGLPAAAAAAAAKGSPSPPRRFSPSPADQVITDPCFNPSHPDFDAAVTRAIQSEVLRLLGGVADQPEPTLL